MLWCLVGTFFINWRIQSTYSTALETQRGIFFCFDELCWRSQWNELALRRTGRERPGVFILLYFPALFLLSNTFALAFGVATVFLWMNCLDLRGPAAGEVPTPAWGMPGSDRHHGTKRKPESSNSGMLHQTQAPSHTSAGDKTSKDGKVQLKSPMSSSSSKRKRHKSTKHNRESSAALGPEYFTLGDSAPPGVNTVKPLVEYDDISSDSDTFSDPPSSRPSERGGGDRLEPSPDYDRDDIDREADGRENKGHRHSRKKSKDPNKVRDAGNGERGYKKKSSKDCEKGTTGKSKEKAAPSGQSSKVQPEGDSKRGELMLSSQVQPAASVGSTTSSTSSSRSKESSRSGKSRKDRQQRRDGRGEGGRSSSQRSRTDRSHRRTSKSHKSSPKGKSSSRGSPRRKGTSSALSPSPRRGAGSESPQGSGCGQQGDDSYSRRRAAQQSPSPYESRDMSRRSRQRSDSPYGSRHRSSSYERDSSPYSRRRSISPYGNRRSSSTSPMSRWV